MKESDLFQNNDGNNFNSNQENSFGEYQQPLNSAELKDNPHFSPQVTTERQGILTQKLKNFVLLSSQDNKEQITNKDNQPLNSEGRELSNIQINSMTNFQSGINNKNISFFKDKDYKERELHTQGGVKGFNQNSLIASNSQLMSNFNQSNQGQKIESKILTIPQKDSLDSQKKNIGCSEKQSALLLSAQKFIKIKPNSITPLGFSGIKNVSGVKQLITEKILANNLRQIVSYVKLRSKLIEIKKFYLRQSISKNLMGQQNSLFAKAIGDPTADIIEQEKFPENLYIFQYLTNLKIIIFLKNLFHKIPIIEPSSKFKIVWDLLIGIVFMIYFFAIPIHIAINLPIHELLTKQLGYSLQVFMGVDILFSMNTGFFEKGVNESNKTKIFLYYIKSYFWGDLISQIPLLISELGSTDSQLEKVFVMCFFVKLRNFQKIFRKFEESFHLSPRSQNILSLIKLILTILFFSHIFSSIWIFVGKQQDQSSNWMVKINMTDEDWLQQYIAAYYFSTVTMITVGYGDIVPQNNLERMISVGTMLISCVIFAYTINQIGTIFSDLFSQDRQMKEYFNIINDYMDYKNIGFSLQYKIREYLDYYWREQDSNTNELEKKIIDSLSEQLREKLLLEANRMVLKDSSLFSNNFNQTVMLKMIPIIQTLHTPPNQVIFSEGQIDEDMFIYFIEKGKVQVCREVNLSEEDQKVSKSIITLGPGQCFGAYSFVTSLARNEMVRSLEFSKLLMVRRSDFLDLICENPQDLEKFNRIKDSILFEKNLSHLNLKCDNCYSLNHSVEHCHYFHFQPDKYVIIKKYNLQFKEQARDQFSRKKKPAIVCLSGFNQISLSGKKWKEEQQQLKEQYIQQYLQGSKDFGENEEIFFQYEDQSGELEQVNSDYDNDESQSWESSDSESTPQESEEQSQDSSNDKKSQNKQNNQKSKQNKDNEPIKEEEEYENEISQIKIEARNANSNQSSQQKIRMKYNNGSNISIEDEIHQDEVIEKPSNSNQNYTIKIQNTSATEINKEIKWDSKINEVNDKSKQRLSFERKKNRMSTLDIMFDKDRNQPQQYNIPQSIEAESDKLSSFDFQSSKQIYYDHLNNNQNLLVNNSDSLDYESKPRQKSQSLISPLQPQYQDLKQDLNKRRKSNFQKLTVQIKPTIKDNPSIIISKSSLDSDNLSNFSPDLVTLKMNSSQESGTNNTSRQKNRNIKDSFRFEDVLIVDNFNCLSDKKVHAKESLIQQSNDLEQNEENNLQKEKSVRGSSNKKSLFVKGKSRDNQESINGSSQDIQEFKLKYRKSAEAKFQNRRVSKQKKSQESQDFNPEKKNLKRTSTETDELEKRTSLKRKTMINFSNKSNSISINSPFKQRKKRQRASTLKLIPMNEQQIDVEQELSKGKKQNRKIFRDMIDEEENNYFSFDSETLQEATDKINSIQKKQKEKQIQLKNSPKDIELNSLNLQNNRSSKSAIISNLNIRNNNNTHNHQTLPIDNLISKKKIASKEKQKGESILHRMDSTDSLHSNSSHTVQNQHATLHSNKKSSFSKSRKEQSMKNLFKSTSMKNVFAHRSSVTGSLVSPSNTTNTPLYFRQINQSENSPDSQGKHHFHISFQQQLQQQSQQQSHDSQNQLLMKGDYSPNTGISKKKHSKQLLLLLPPTPGQLIKQNYQHSHVQIQFYLEINIFNFYQNSNLESAHDHLLHNNILKKNQTKLENSESSRIGNNNQNSSQLLKPRASFRQGKGEGVQMQLIEMLGKNNGIKEEQKTDINFQNQILNLLQANFNQQQQQMQNQQNQLQNNSQMNSQNQQSALHSPTAHPSSANHKSQYNIHLHNHSDSDKNFFNMMDFDQMKIFKYYFPKGNYSMVIQKINLIVSSNLFKFIKKIKKSKMNNMKKSIRIEDTTNVIRKNSIFKKGLQLSKRKSITSPEILIQSQNNISIADDNNKLSKIHKPSQNSVPFINHHMNDDSISLDSDNIKFPSSNTEIKVLDTLKIGSISPKEASQSILKSKENE